MNYTLSVFKPEAHLDKDSYSRDEIVQMLQLHNYVYNNDDEVTSTNSKSALIRDKQPLINFLFEFLNNKISLK